MPLNISLLSHNLQEMCAASQDGKPIESLLVPSPFSESLYDTRSIQAVACQAVYSITNFFARICCCQCTSGTEISIKRMFDAKKKTKELLLEQIEVIYRRVVRYQEYLVKCSNGNEVTERDEDGELEEIPAYTISRADIVKWTNVITPFYDDLRKNRRYTELFEFTPEEQARIDFVHHQVDLCSRVIDMESYSEVPFRVFKDVSLERIKDDSSKEKLRLFVEDISKEQDIKIEDLHRFFDSYARLINDEQESKESVQRRVARMELDYWENIPKTKMFLQSDPEQIEWRNDLSAGSTITTADGKTLTLGEEISPKDKLDRNLVFRIVEREDQVLVVPNNLSILAINSLKQELAQKEKSRQQQETKDRFASAEFIEIDPNSRWALKEKIKPIQGINWQTKSLKEFAASDRELCIPIAKGIKELIKQNLTPFHLTTRHIGLNSQNRLRSVKEIKFKMDHQRQNYIDYEMYEKFITDIANGNRYIRSALIEETGLNKLPEHKFYREVVILAVNCKAKKEIKEESEIDKIGAKYRIVSREILRNGFNVYNETITKVKECITSLKKDHQFGIEAGEKVRSVFKRFYTESWSKQLPPNSWEKVKAKVISDRELEKKEAESKRSSKIAEREKPSQSAAPAKKEKTFLWGLF